MEKKENKAIKEPKRKKVKDLSKGKVVTPGFYVYTRWNDDTEVTEAEFNKKYKEYYGAKG